jgi:hypothetical protein
LSGSPSSSSPAGAAAPPRPARLNGSPRRRTESQRLARVESGDFTAAALRRRVPLRGGGMVDVIGGRWRRSDAMGNERSSGAELGEDKRRLLACLDRSSLRFDFVWRRTQACYRLNRGL